MGPRRSLAGSGLRPSRRKIARTLQAVIPWPELAKMFIGLLVVVDPIGVVPLFLTLTERHAGARRKIALAGAFTMLVVLLVAGFLGEGLLMTFGISLASFKVMGGVLLMVMALDMLNARPSRAKRTPEEEEEAVSKRELAVVPLGIPLLAGPGAMSSSILYIEQAQSGQAKAQVVGVIVLACTLALLALLSASWLARRLGQTGINILKRIFGLITGAIAVEFMVSGLGELLPGLAAQ